MLFFIIHTHMDYFDLFMQQALKAADRFSDDMAQDPHRGTPERWHHGIDMPDGSRFYFEWRASRG